jgi:hypothetical protein
MRDLGFKDVDDEWLKGKFLQTLMPYSENIVMNVYARTDYMSLSPSDVLGVFVTINMMKKSSEHTIARVNGAKRVYLALKAKAHEEEGDSDDSGRVHVPDTKEMFESWNECLALAANQWWKKKGDFTSSSSRYKGKVASRDSNGNEKKARTCFNCGNASHFVNECPYENRAENGGRLAKKTKFIPQGQELHEESTSKGSCC